MAVTVDDAEPLVILSETPRPADREGSPVLLLAPVAALLVVGGLVVADEDGLVAR